MVAREPPPSPAPRTSAATERPSRSRLTPSLLGVVLLLALAGLLQGMRDRNAPASEPLATQLYVRSGDTMRRLALSFDAVLADVYWIRAIQHFGGTRRATDGRPKRYDLLYPLLDVTTSLDPYFTIAYRFGAIFLAEPPPGGPGRPDQAIALLEKGIRASPDRWRYYQDIGFVYYWWLRDTERAATWFERGGKVPGAPWWLTSLAATTRARGGDRRSSRALWTMLLQTADNEWLQRDAARRLRQLDAMDQIERLQELVDTYREREPLRPLGWDTLVAAGLLDGIPLDPDGVSYALDADSGRVSLHPESPLGPLPSEPEPAPAPAP